MVGLRTFGIVTRRFRGSRLVIQKSPQKFKMGKSLSHWLLVRVKASEVGMSKFISPSVVIPLHVRGRQLDPCSMDHDDELHEERRGWHMLRLLVQEGENVALIVGDETKPSAE